MPRWKEAGVVHVPVPPSDSKRKTEGTPWKVPSSMCLARPLPVLAHPAFPPKYRYLAGLRTGLHDTLHLPCRYLFPPSVASREIARAGKPERSCELPE